MRAQAHCREFLVFGDSLRGKKKTNLSFLSFFDFFLFWSVGSYIVNLYIQKLFEFFVDFFEFFLVGIWKILESKLPRPARMEKAI